ncbi:DUF1801 domain-containing protein [Altibacter sp.]|uniref:DUF1801 domain-containing protein n=1 Tax=Altibacter sp. TaxID=2024823 RepID=UPI000C968112|nr:DUF1801 domain-containing protein [Altibacter sp.]MAP54603.1 2-dehydro-3-deoxyphosphooctonate aldolase [Altibacter sp.]
MNPAEAYILSKEEPYRAIMLHLQLVIETTIPEADLKFKWHLPFYYLSGKNMFCYLNQSKKYVDLCFTRGAHLTKHLDVLVSENRKHMKSLRYFALEDIDDGVLVDLLQEAYALRALPIYK